MGCDIHLFLEDLVQDEWQYIKEVNFGRYYPAFGLLAGVRSSIIKPMTNPRGLPEDVSKHVKELAHQWDDDAHTDSYLTLKEILEYNWQQEIVQEGYVSLYSYTNYLQDQELTLLYLQEQSWSRTLLVPFTKLNWLAHSLLALSKLEGETGEELSSNKFIQEHDCTAPFTRKTKPIDWCSSLYELVVELSKTYPQGRLVFWFDN